MKPLQDLAVALQRLSNLATIQRWKRDTAAFIYESGVSTIDEHDPEEPKPFPTAIERPDLEWYWRQIDDTKDDLVIDKARQNMISHAMRAAEMAKVLFTPNVKIALVFDDEGEAKKQIEERTHAMFRSLPPWFKDRYTFKQRLGWFYVEKCDGRRWNSYIEPIAKNPELLRGSTSRGSSGRRWPSRAGRRLPTVRRCRRFRGRETRRRGKSRRAECSPSARPSLAPSTRCSSATKSFATRPSPSPAWGISRGMTYYNEHDAYPAQWLRNLIEAGHLPSGRVDERSIADVEPDDVAIGSGHFFAGIGGWPYALELAGWPQDRLVWTGSCPCQPFSQAGKRGGFDDRRHLWPAWFKLIRECRPPTIFGEQVASPDGLKWLSLVQADLEGEGYRFGAADLCAASIGAPHIRQRFFWVADTGRIGGELDGLDLRGEAQGSEREARQQWIWPDVGDGGDAGRLADTDQQGLSFIGRELPEDRDAPSGHNVDGGCADGWADIEWIDCRDGKRRPTQPGLLPLAHGVPGRVGKLRAYGNAIVPQAAAAFVRAYLES